jgi:hypothetical protein
MKTDANQCFDLMVKTINDLAMESDRSDAMIMPVDIDPKIKEQWLEVWRRILNQLNEWEHER